MSSGNPPARLPRQLGEDVKVLGITTMRTHRLSALVLSVLVSACGGPAASPAPETETFASLPGIPVGGSGGLEPPDSTADDAVGEGSPPEAAGGAPALLDVVSAGGAGGAPAAAEADPCWDRPGIMCHCGLPNAAPPAGSAFSIVDRCLPPATPSPGLEWCCDTWAGICRCYQRSPGECAYWREEGSWVAGCSAV